MLDFIRYLAVAVLVSSTVFAQGDTAHVAEDQTPTGKFTTATEVKPILSATKSHWVAVREFNGQDLIYVSHLWAWRCGLIHITMSINGNEVTPWPMPPCYVDLAQPNAIKDGDIPYKTYKLQSVETIDVTVTYDDLTTDQASFKRQDIKIP